MIKISPSILSCDFSQLKAEVDRISRSADMVHVDVMDGVFVPNITIGQPVVKSLRGATDLPLDVHLMITQPERHVESFCRAGADIVTIHAEAAVHLHRVLGQIRDNRIRAGVALNPATPVSAIENVLDMVDMVLIMSVNPGFGGQTIIEQCLRKVEQVVRMRDEAGADFDIEVDGGINDETIRSAARAGANVFVAGSYVFGAENPDEAVRRLALAAEEEAVR